MNSLFLLLLLVCFIALILGMIKPPIVIRWGNIEKRNRKNVLKYYGVGLIVFFILFGVTSSNTGTVQKNTSSNLSTSTTTSKDKKAAADLDKKIAALGDVNALTLDKATNVNETEAAYQALTKDQKGLVTKLNILTAAKKKIADLQSAADKAAAEKAAAEKAAADKVAYDTGITYDQLARTPDNYKEKKVKLSGKVIQVIEGNSETDLRIAINNNYDTILLASYKPNITPTRVLENDNVTIKGVSQGLYTYNSTIGGKITLPLVLVDNITINN